MKEIGYIAEENLAKLIAEPLLIDFVHLSPTCLEGEKERELCDILIEDEPLAIPTEIKFQDKSKARVTRNEKNWAENKLKTAARQIRGAINYIGKTDIIAKHPYRGKVTFSACDLRCKHGLIIVDYNLEPFKLSDQYPRRTKDNIPIHYLTYKDFIILCEKLISLPDLIIYLNERSKIPAWSTPFLNDEKNTYAYFLTHGRIFEYSINHSDFRGQWDYLTIELKGSYISKEIEDEKALIFNEMLTHLSTNQPVLVDPDAKYIKTITSLEDTDRLKITQNLNRIQTLHRRYISRKLLEKIEKTNSSKRGYRYFAFQAKDKDTFFVFMASKFSRKERVKHLIELCDCVNNLRDIKRIIGVATDAMHPPNGRSYDFIIMEDFQRENDPQYISNCKEFFQEFGEEKEDDFPIGF